ncbi:ABC transporter permease subunit [uncultured Actinomyces sp.]|uniref:ABC transporter permease n=1 Tax=uncultured Actinomyces sp. TaxID=249061 RepID=UPI0028EAE1FE|nr:ABC transporter permease subunit [uncultured Actinomyces sp.]
MNLLLEAVEWLKEGQNWLGPSGILVRTGQHVLFVVAVVLISALIALPIGVYIGHTGRWKNLVLTATGAARAVPTLGLLTLIGLWLGIGWQAPLIALVALAMPPILAGAYSGVISAQGSSDAARAIGLTERQILTQLEIPAGAPLIITGLRSAVLQVIATATLAAYTANLGLGRFLYVGLKTRDYGQMIGGALVVVVIALIVDLLFGRLQARASRRLGGGEVGEW